MARVIDSFCATERSTMGCKGPALWTNTGLPMSKPNF